MANNVNGNRASLVNTNSFFDNVARIEVKVTEVSGTFESRITGVDFFEGNDGRVFMALDVEPRDPKTVGWPSVKALVNIASEDGSKLVNVLAVRVAKSNRISVKGGRKSLWVDGKREACITGAQFADFYAILGEELIGKSFTGTYVPGESLGVGFLNYVEDSTAGAMDRLFGTQ